MNQSPAMDGTDARLRRLVMIVRQACYFVADELGKEYGLERPCKTCDQQRRRNSRPQERETRPDRAV